MNYDGHAPAEVSTHSAEVAEIVIEIGIGLHVEVITLVVDVAVLGNQVHVEETDVDVDVGASFPAEVERLRHVREVEWCLQVLGVVKVLSDDVFGSYDFHPYNRDWLECLLGGEATAGARQETTR